MSYKNTLKKVERLYDHRIKSSQDGVKAAGQWGSVEFLPKICEEIYKKIRLKESDKVLELGCGSGVLGDGIANRCAHYVGIDLSLEMLKFFKKSSSNQQKYNLIHGITDKIPLQNNIFDTVVMNGVTMYFQNEKMLKETFDAMRRVVKPNGTIFIGENVVSSGFPWELTWFKNLSTPSQFMAKPYIRFRKWLANKNSRLSGKWTESYYEIDPNFVFNYFEKYGKIIQSKAAAYTIKERIFGKNYKGNRRMDFLIQLK